MIQKTFTILAQMHVHLYQEVVPFLVLSTSTLLCGGRSAFKRLSYPLFIFQIICILKPNFEGSI